MRYRWITESDEDDDEESPEDESDKFKYDWSRVEKWLWAIEDENPDASG